VKTMSEVVKSNPSFVECREIRVFISSTFRGTGLEVRPTNVGGVPDLSATLGEQS
jgi:hypothetical protein